MSGLICITRESATGARVMPVVTGVLVGVALGGSGVKVDVLVGVLVAVGDGPMVGVLVGVGVGVLVAVLVGVGLGPVVGVIVGVFVGGTGVLVGVDPVANVNTSSGGKFPSRESKDTPFVLSGKSTKL